MSNLCTRCHIAIPAASRISGLLTRRYLASVVNNHSAPARFERSPAAKSLAKVMALETFWWTTNRSDDRQLLSDLLQAIRSRSHNKLIEIMYDLQERNMTHLLNVSHLEVILRSIRPLDFFKAPRAKESYKLYRRRMTFMRKWITSSGIKVSTEIYFLMLEEARLTKAYSGRSQLAIQTWSDMLAAGVQPDVHCYNAFIGATCIQPAALDKARLRRSKDDVKRRQDRLYRLQKAEVAVQRAIVLYREMLAQGIEPSNMTIELLVVALGWCANFSGLRSLILQTWNILLPEPDTVSLEDQSVPDEYDEEGIDLADKVDSPVNVAKVSFDSSIFPTQETLVAVASAFGVSQQSRLAIQAVQLFGKVYGLTISTKVWTELMKWSSADSERLYGFTSHAQVEWIMKLARDQYGIRPSPSMFSAAIQHSLLGVQISNRTYELVDEMFTSIMRESPIDRPMFKYTEICPHARQIAIGAMMKVKRNRSRPLGQLTRKLERARPNGGIDEIRLLENDIDRRTVELEKDMNKWTDRIRQFDNEIDKLVKSQVANVKIQQARRAKQDHSLGTSNFDEQCKEISSSSNLH